jgi:hypothetical protein
MDSEAIPVEIDAPWFDPMWLLDHPDFPLSASVEEHNPDEEEA